ncbi:calcium uptake protein 3, mitochondrial isoform X1 [Gambusia affinis]|uniref:calcium uptake protein 3, mitochondrial isoform X1 n=2 Tax=Gambusia affinis TaxID=33528 RepID=UPI001CDC117F|nr:calcium uptake protein 3, mitochondrial isoform X1 [Gambusia affinis]XP_043983411.1 calcium uptake protein 3, mitochondrial isoform X1 [Gambusia affinis]XP_043983412.1 calcium uptake protein 3, mitochondrial isoform X1 [Gambusia affinis]
MAAALRRLGASLRNGALLQQTPSNGRRELKVVAAGACVAAAAGAAALYCGSVVGVGPRSRVEARLVHLALPTVSATDKAKTYDLDDGDVYMSTYENRFRLFSSVECEGQLYMTPLNFIESVTLSQPRSRRGWKSLTKKELDKVLSDTPPVWKGSSNLFRNLRERGAISYTEYLFLLCILTKPHAGFWIAFNMFDADGNEMVDKREFLVLEEIFRKKKDRKDVADDVQRLEEQSLQLYGHRKSQTNSVRKNDAQHAGTMWDVLRRSTSQVLFSDLTEHVDEKTETTLLVHFFGKKGKAELKFEDFYKFMDNLQTEVLEIEFLSYSKGMPTISEEDFARILLRYTNVDDVSGYMENVRHSIPDEKGISFEEFRSFFQFLNNLEDFTIAMQMYNFAHRSVGQDEFTRAVYVATGIKLSHHLVNTVFKIFDEDHDGKLSHKEFIGVMKDRLHRGDGGVKAEEKFISFKSCMKKELSRK